MWLGATVWDHVATEHLSHPRKFCWTALIQKSSLGAKRPFLLCSKILRSWLPLWWRRELNPLEAENLLGAVHLSGKEVPQIWDSGLSSRNLIKDRLWINLIFFLNGNINCANVDFTKLQKHVECFTPYLPPFHCYSWVILDKNAFYPPRGYAHRTVIEVIILTLNTLWP